MITHHIDPENRLIELTINGKISKEDLKAALNALEDPFEKWSEIRLLKRIDSFEGMELKAMADDLKFAYNNFGNLKKIRKAAVVTDKEWIEKITDWFKPLFPGEVKVFENEDIEKARSWLS